MAERQPSKLHVASSNLVSRSTPPRVGAGASSTDADHFLNPANQRAAIADGALRLRRALSQTVHPSPTLNLDAANLSKAYRASTGPLDPRGHVHDPATAAAYAAARMPATHAACTRAMIAVAERLPGFGPASLLDVGAGAGAAAWAATAVWPSLAELTLVDREPAAIALGRRLAAGQAPTSLAVASWLIADLDRDLAQRADLVVAAYVLGEIASGEAAAVIARCWASTAGVLLLVEPGSRAGFERIRAARADLIAAGGHVVAPCPGDEACPIVGPAWCHFLARLDRSPLQRGAKAAARSWEDEPFSYVAVSRRPATPAPRIVLGRPRHRPGVVELRVCVDGRIEQRTLSRRDGPAYKAARHLEWGDAAPIRVLDADATADADADADRDATA